MSVSAPRARKPCFSPPVPSWPAVPPLFFSARGRKTQPDHSISLGPRRPVAAFPPFSRFPGRWPKRSKTPFARSVRLNPGIPGKANGFRGQVGPGWIGVGTKSRPDPDRVWRTVRLPQWGKGARTGFEKGRQKVSKSSPEMDRFYRNEPGVKSGQKWLKRDADLMVFCGPVL